MTGSHSIAEVEEAVAEADWLTLALRSAPDRVTRRTVQFRPDDKPIGLTRPNIERLPGHLTSCLAGTSSHRKYSIAQSLAV